MLPLVRLTLTGLTWGCRAMGALGAVVVVAIAAISTLCLIALVIARALCRGGVRAVVVGVLCTRGAGSRTSRVHLLLLFGDDEDASASCWGP